MKPEDLKPSDRIPFTALNQHFGGTLHLEAFYESGSTARVYHVKQRLGLGDSYRVDRIAKVFRHDSADLPPLASTSMFLKEVQTLLSVAHTNIVSLYDAGSLQLEPTVSTHYFLMEYLPGGRDLDHALLVDQTLLAATPDVRTFIVSLLLQIAHGLEGLHSQGVLHCDLKLGNILLGGIGAAPTAKITDFGFSKHVHGDSLTLDGGTGTMIYTTLDYLPAKYRTHPYLKKEENRDRVLVSIPKAELAESFDLHYFGVIVGKLLGVALIANAFSAFDVAYLSRMVRRLSLDLPREPHKYSRVVDVIRDLRKLDKNYVAVAGLPELSPLAATRIVRLPVNGNVALTDRVKHIIDHPWFARLNTAMQLGYTYLVFPGATHTRFEHSLGVFAHTAEYLQALLGSSASPAFRQLISEEMLV
ncbi:MAG: protein kinase [Thermoanaerobaculia bacterium]|jgi:serine/threonine protein kinase